MTELRTGLRYCNRTKAWIEILHLENRNLVNALGLGLGYKSGELAHLHLLPVEAQLAEPVKSIDIHEATLIKPLQHISGMNFYGDQSHNFKPHDLGQVPPDSF